MEPAPFPRARVAEIAVPLPVADGFTYRIPGDIERLQVGHAVIVPFGKRQTVGYVTALPDHGPADVALKDIERLADPEPAFGDRQLEFFRWIADYYVAPLGEVIATALPVAYRARSRSVYAAQPAGIEAIAQETLTSPEAALVLREVIARPGRTRRGLHRILYEEIDADAVDRALDHLVRTGLLSLDTEEVGEPGGRIATVTLSGSAGELLQTGGARMRGVLTQLVEAGGTIDLSRLVELEGPGAREATRRLAQKGLVTLGEREDRTAFHGGPVTPDTPKALNPLQQAALDAICAGTAETFLLHGVTGSGKTEVYLQATAKVLENDRQALVLVPEISLTPQLCARFAARFGDRIAVLHSGLTPLDRLREWRRIRAREAKVAIGARSALFAPFHDLGLVIVDEEHDDSYKQDEGVRYHARDLAVVLGRLSECPVVLGSATPSLESWQNAEDGRYRKLLLPVRATPRAVPRIELVDMRGRPTDKALSTELQTALADALRGDGKAIVLFNRRGYAPTLECPGCGAHYACPSCGVELVYHQSRGRLLCHYCGFFRRYEKDCPACGSGFAVLGFGTERLEEELRQEFPDVGIARMDADTTSTRGSHARILDSFKSGEVRLLVGTQLVAKGHDFPDVTVAAVVGVDHILLLPDFRSAERTHALVTQLAGRAGRGSVAGRVIVQTRHADHFVFRQLAEASQDLQRETFYEEEVRGRRALQYPPFTRLVLLRIEGTEREATLDAARTLSRSLKDRLRASDRIDVLGPTSAPLGRLVGRWRFQVVLRGRHPATFRKWIREIRSIVVRPPHSGIRLTIDVDPRNLM